jgi:MFS family permease
MELSSIKNTKMNNKNNSRLWNRDFLIQWQGQMVSRLGSQAFFIGQLFWIKQTTDSATLIGILAMVSSLPGLIMGPVGGVLADRYSRKWIIILSDLFRGVSILILCGVMWLVPENNTFILLLIFIISVINAIIMPVFSSAIQSTIPDLVPGDKVASANSVTQLSVQASLFFGQMLGGTLYRILGALTLFFVDALSFFYSSFSETFVRIPQENVQTSIDLKNIYQSFGRDLVEGWSYIMKRPGLKEAILASALIAFFSTPVIILLPFYIEDVLNVTVDWYGYILAFSGIGAVFGYILAGTIPIRGMTKSRTLIFFMLINALGYGMLGLIRNPYLAVFTAFIAGIATGFITVHISSIIQLSTPTVIRGRVLGLLGALSGSLTPLAMGISGVLADLLDQNISIIYIGCGMIMGIVAIVFALSRDFRGFLAYTPDLQKKDETPIILNEQ